MAFEGNNWTGPILEHWWKVLLSLFFTHLSYKFVSRRWLSPLSKFPGPFWAGVTNIYAIYHNWTGKQYILQSELHKKYGPIVRYRPNLLIVSDPTMLPVIYHRYADKTNFYIQIVGATTTFTSLKHEDHVISRRWISGPYSTPVVTQLQGRIDTWIDKWINKLRDNFSKNGQSQDFNDQLLWLSYDLIADLTFGKPFGFVDASQDVKGIINNAVWTALFHEAIDLMPNLLWLLKNTRIGRSFLPKGSPDFGYGYIMAEAERLALSDEVNPAADKTFLRMFLEAKSADGKSMAMQQLVSEARIMLIGGARPLASTTVEFLLNILSRPGCYDKLMAEIEEAESQGRLSAPVPTFEEAQGLVYLQACLNETFRGAESTVTMVPRMAAKGGTEILGQFVPEGTHLSATPWVMHRNRELYGEDAELFRPERWLEASPEKVQQWKKYDFQFGYGTRACPGKLMTQIILSKLFLQILRTFKMQRSKECTLENYFTRRLHEDIPRDEGLFIERLRT